MCSYSEEVYRVDPGKGPEVSGDNRALHRPSLPYLYRGIKRELTDVVPLALFCSQPMDHIHKYIACNVNRVLFPLKRVLRAPGTSLENN